MKAISEPDYFERKKQYGCDRCPQPVVLSKSDRLLMSSLRATEGLGGRPKWSRSLVQGSQFDGSSIQMMNQHYRNTIDDENTITAFWELAPAKLLAKKPEIELPAKPKVPWPKKESIKKLVWKKPLMHATTEIGVSDDSAEETLR